jgi:replication-associated recombination protein RarA
MQLYNQYRPNTLDDIVGHGREKTILSRLSLGGRAIWITGISGIGKSSFAGIIAGMVADPFNVMEIDAGRLTPAMLEDIERGSRCLAIGDKPGRCYIVNEAHGLRSDTVRQLLVTLENLPEHVTWVFTTTVDGMAKFDGIDSAPLLSRCLALNLKPDREAFAERAKSIAESVGLGGASLEKYIKLSKLCDDNLRMMLGHIESGLMMTEREVA